MTCLAFCRRRALAGTQTIERLEGSIRLWVFFILTCWLNCDLTAAPRFRQVSPIYGPPGTVVHVQGEDFDPKVSCAVTLAGVSVTP